MNDVKADMLGGQRQLHKFTNSHVRINHRAGVTIFRAINPRAFSAYSFTSSAFVYQFVMKYLLKQRNNPIGGRDYWIKFLM